MQHEKIEKKKEKVGASIRTEEEGKRAGDEEVSRLIKELDEKNKELDDKNMEISALKQELETMKQTHEVQIQDKNTEILALKQEFEIKEKKYEEKLKLIQKHVTFQSGCVQVNLYTVGLNMFLIPVKWVKFDFGPYKFFIGLVS